MHTEMLWNAVTWKSKKGIQG